MKLRKALTFDDILLVPKYSNITKIDDEIDTSTNLNNLKLEIPIISAAMDTVTGNLMQRSMRALGGTGIHHRYINNIHVMEHLFEQSKNGPVAVSPKMNMHYFVVDMEPPQKTIVIDVGHGERQEALDFAKTSVDVGLEVWSGNVCTAEGALAYYNAGVNVIKVGIGPGSACITRTNTGCGMPQAEAIYDIRNNLYPKPDDLFIIADGGIKNAGDIVKALALGADAVILGGLLAGTDEAPGDILVGDDGRRYKEYRGMASEAALKQNNKTVRVEGVSGMVPYKGPVEDVINSLMSGVKLGMAYVGARNIKELREKAEFVEITSAGQREGMARI